MYFAALGQCTVGWSPPTTQCRPWRLSERNMLVSESCRAVRETGLVITRHRSWLEIELGSPDSKHRALTTAPLLHTTWTLFTTESYIHHTQRQRKTNSCKRMDLFSSRQGRAHGLKTAMLWSASKQQSRQIWSQCSALPLALLGPDSLRFLRL